MPLKHTSVPTRRRRRAVRRIDELTNSRARCVTGRFVQTSDVGGVGSGEPLRERVSCTECLPSLGSRGPWKLSAAHVSRISPITRLQYYHRFRHTVRQRCTEQGFSIWRPTFLPPGGGETQFRGRGDAISGGGAKTLMSFYLSVTRAYSSDVILCRLWIENPRWREELSRAANNRWPIRYSKLKTTSRCKNK